MSDFGGFGVVGNDENGNIINDWWVSNYNSSIDSVYGYPCHR